jgi:hypothetical protein
MVPRAATPRRPTCTLRTRRRRARLARRAGT